MSTEQEKWLASDPETRGMSPAEQLKRPLGFRSKREYREWSVYGNQDEARNEKRKEENWDLMRETFGEDVSGVIISPDPKTMEKNFKEVARLEELIEDLQDQPQEVVKAKKKEFSPEEPRWHWESREMPSGRSIDVKIYDNWSSAPAWGNNEDTRYMSTRQAHEYFLETGTSWGR